MHQLWQSTAIKPRDYKNNCLCLERAHSINMSCETLMRILSEPQRDRALLIASVNRNLNSEILKFMQPFSKLFEVLQFNSKPTINFAVLTYYKAAELAKRCPTDNLLLQR